MAPHYAFVELYATRIPVAGWGSTVLLAIAAAIVVALPAARQLTAAGLMGGVVFGVLLIVRRASTHEGSQDGFIHLSS